MRITFWGIRGSIPSPMTADEFRIKVKRLLINARNVNLNDESTVDAYLDTMPFPDAMTFGGNTPCVEICKGKHQIILDCGSGIRLLGRQMMKTGLTSGQRIDILQSHTHWDHMIGFPFFAPAFSKGTEIHIHGVHPNLEERFKQQMDRVHFPITLDEMGAQITFHQLKKEKDFTLGPFTINTKGLHHPGGSYSYRITSGDKTVVYATDGEYKEPTDEVYAPFIEFYKDADVLIFDAMYATLEKTVERENFGHSTAIIGVGLALSACVKKLVLFHHDPEINDSQIAQAFFDAKRYLETRGKAISDCPLKLITSYDGLTIDA
ncbi:MBL fold metallo-hydrolase [Candidatus Latescibacterota bacterium]